jgi:hypothetical protein
MVLIAALIAANSLQFGILYHYADVGGDLQSTGFHGFRFGILCSNS